jgi:DNA-binding NarL/FixJ family response regulator
MRHKILFADDHILLRDALANLISDFPEFNVIAKAANGKEVIELIEGGEQPDILLMDLSMPKMDGYETAKWVHKQHPEIKIVILTMYDSEIALIRLLRSGISGFLKKDIHPTELREALLTVAAGDFFYSNKTTGKLVSHFKKETENNFDFSKLVLNDLEFEFIKLSATDMSYKKIGETMNLKPRYVERFRIALFTKIKVYSRVELVIYAYKNGIASI